MNSEQMFKFGEKNLCQFWFNVRKPNKRIQQVVVYIFSHVLNMSTTKKVFFFHFALRMSVWEYNSNAKEPPSPER